MKRSLTRGSLGALLIAASVGAGCAALGAATDATTAGTSAVTGGTSAVTGAKSAGDSVKGLAPGAGGSGGSGGAAGGDDPDSDPQGAGPISPNTAVKDSLDPAKKDTVDFKVINLGTTGKYATFQLTWLDPTAELSLDVFNEDLQNVATAPHRSGATTSKSALVKVDAAGNYYVKVGWMTGSTKTTYSLKVKYDGSSSAPVAGGGGSAPPQPPAAAPAPPPAAVPPVAGPPQAQVPNPGQGAQVPNPGAPAGGAPGAPGMGAPGAPPAGAAPPAGGGPTPPATPTGPIGEAGPAAPASTDANHPRGRVLNVYRDDDGSLVLNLNRGKSSGLRAGMKGHVLLGPDPGDPTKPDYTLDGSEFTIIRVLDETKAQGKLRGRQTLGSKNNRFVVHLVRWP